MSVDRRVRWLVSLALAVAVGAAVLVTGGSSRSVEAVPALPPVADVEAREQAQPACPDAVGGLGITQFQQRSGNLTSSQTLGCTYSAPVGTIGQARLLLRWNDPATTVSQQCHSETELREERTTSNGNPVVTLWSATHQIQVEAVIVQQGSAGGIADAEAVAAAWLASQELIAFPCAPDPEPIVPGSLACPPRIDDLVWLGYYSSGPDIGLPAERFAGTTQLPGLQLGCSYQAAYDDVEARASINVTWVEPGGTPPRDEECRDFGRDRTVYSAAKAARASYDDPSRFAAAASEDAVREAMLALFDAAEQRAAACPQAEIATPTETTESPTPSATSAPNSCAPRGVVMDHAGDPMVGLRVRLHLNGEVADQRVTDGSGAFEFSELDFLAESYGFDLANDRYEVGVVLRDAIDGEARFQIHYGSDAVLPDVRRTAKTVEDDPSCENSFAFADINDDDYRVELGPDTPAKWRSLAFSYQHIRIAWNFATDVLGVTFDNELPLKVYTYCSGSPQGWWGLGNCGTTAASFLGPVTQDRQQDGSPLIQFSSGFGRGKLAGGDRPVNGEYHELGHALMSDSFGNLMPGRADETNHAGFANPTSTDSWTEGFAEWFAAMVQRETVGGSWWLYPISGRHSIEDDRKPTVGGKHNEELSIAGVLVDMVDSSADYAAPTGRALTLLQAAFIDDPDDPDANLYIAEFRNDTNSVQRDIGFSVDYGGFAGAFASRIDGIVDPAVLAPGEVGQAVAVLPPSVTSGQVNSVRIEGFSTQDDDAVSHTPREVWDVIVGYRGSGEPGNGFVIDMSELYEALITGFPDEADAIDQIFVNHGWYADLGDTPNGQYDEGEPIGVTSKDGAAIRTAPDRDVVFDARLDTGAVASRAFVQVLYPEPREALSYAFEAPVDPDSGTIALAVPPPESGAVLRIVLSADGHLPVVLDDIEAATFWADAEANGYQPFVELEATLREGNAFGAEDDGSSLPLPLLAGAAAAVVAVLGGGGWLMRRRGRGVAA
ncbi:MAG: hypothetical protein O3A10_00085 [Chloroflexi bacterium]|nr:hypothetical protein [Chloroflexota bacterium]MDA1145355.1 hypothetical protein [Chloroflexota bacterium]